MSRLRQRRGRSRPRSVRRGWMGPGQCAGTSRWTCCEAGVEEGLRVLAHPGAVRTILEHLELPTRPAHLTPAQGLAKMALN